MRTAPPDWRTTPKTIDNPNPVPLPISFVVKNGSNARSMTSRLIPVPLSRKDTRTQSPPAISVAQGERLKSSANRLGQGIPTERFLQQYFLADVFLEPG